LADRADPERPDAGPPPDPAPAVFDAPPPGAYAWALVGMLWLICFINYADRYAISSVVPLLQRRYRFTNSEIGVITAAFMWVYALAAPLAGKTGDRYSRKWVILGGLAAWSLITGLTAKCVQFWQFVAVRGAEGLGETFYMPASMALVSDYHGPATRSRAIGIHQTSIYAGTIFGGALAGWMGSRWGWQSPFVALAAAGVVLALALRLAIREPDRAPEHAVEPLAWRDFLAALARSPVALLLLAAYCGANLVGYVPLTWMPKFLTEKFHLGLATAGLGATLFIQTGSMCGALLGGAIADRWVRVRGDGRILVQATATLAGSPFLFICGHTTGVRMLMAAMFLFGLCKGMYDANLTSAYYDFVPVRSRATATGVMNLLGWASAGIGSFAFGFALDRHVTMSAAISSTALIYLLVCLLLGYACVNARRR
jgi:MFS family permease